MEILSAVTGVGGSENCPVNPAKLAPFIKPVAKEQEVLTSMKLVLSKQVCQVFHARLLIRNRLEVLHYGK
jgi:hypothetical protein